MTLKTSDASGKNPIDVTVSGTLQDSDFSDTLTLGGSPLTSNDATGINSGVSIVSSLTVPGSYSFIPSSNFISNPNNTAIFNGRFKVDAVSVDGTNTPQNWVTITPREGDEETKQITLSFQGNYSYGGVRYLRIRFLAFNTNAVLHTISVTQNSLTIF